jgi:hypothetical protein
LNQSYGDCRRQSAQPRLKTAAQSFRPACAIRARQGRPVPPSSSMRDAVAVAIVQAGHVNTGQRNSDAINHGPAGEIGLCTEEWRTAGAVAVHRHAVGGDGDEFAGGDAISQRHRHRPGKNR